MRVVNSITKVRNERLELLQKLSDGYMQGLFDKTDNLDTAFNETQILIRRAIRKEFVVSINTVKDYVETVTNHSYKKIMNGELKEIPPIMI